MFEKGKSKKADQGLGVRVLGFWGVRVLVEIPHYPYSPIPPIL